MNLYEISQWANGEKCDMNGYGQKIFARIISSGEGVDEENETIWYSEKFLARHIIINTPYDIHYYPVFIRREFVKAETSKHAIEKFLEWERKGLDKSFLLGE